MKLRSREVNVFSMSALDLFASAMGAFMFLAIIALPFFPNTGDSTESVAEIKKELKDLQADNDKTKKDLDAAQEELEQAQQELAEGISKYPIELVITIDISGSMAVPLQRLKEAIARLTVEIPKVTKEFRIGVVAYGGEGRYTTISMIKVNGSTRDQFNRQVNALALIPGSTDVPEAVDQAMSMYSSPNDKVRKAYVLIGDVGPYEMIGSREFDIYNMSNAQAERLINSGRETQVNKSYEAQIYKQVEDFSRTNKLQSVMAMYTGNATRQGDASYLTIALTKKSSTAFFKKISELGGEDTGHYSEDPSEMLSMLLLAVLSAA